MPLNIRQQTVLWEAVNAYIKACGGDTSNQTIGKAREEAVFELEKTVALLLGVEDIVSSLQPRLPRWIARVQQTPFDFTTPERVVVEAETEADAKQTLESAGYTDDFRWHIREIQPEQPGKGRIISPQPITLLS